MKLEADLGRWLLSVLCLTFCSKVTCFPAKYQRWTPDSISSGSNSAERSILCPEPTGICTESRMSAGQNEKLPCLSHEDCTGQKMCCWDTCWNNYTCQNPLITLKLVGHDDYVKDKNNQNEHENNKIDPICINCNGTVKSASWTSSINETYSENGTVISEMKKLHAKIKRAAKKKTPKPKNKSKTTVKSTTKKTKKKKKSRPKTTQKSSTKSPKKNKTNKKNSPKKNSSKKNSSKKIPEKKNPTKKNPTKKNPTKKNTPKKNSPSKSNSAKNNKKKLKHEKKNAKKPTQKAKILKTSAKSRQKVTKKVTQTTKSVPTSLKRTQESIKTPVVTNAVTPVTGSFKKNNADEKVYFKHSPTAENECGYHVFHGNFKLHSDVKPHNFFDERFQTLPDRKDVKCSFNVWDKDEEIKNLLVIGILKNRTPRFKREMDEKLKEIIVHRSRMRNLRWEESKEVRKLENVTPSMYLKGGSFDRTKSVQRKENENKNVSYGADEGFAGAKPPLSKEQKGKNFSYGADENFARVKSPLRKDHDTEIVSYRADDNFNTEKTSLEKQYENDKFSYGVDESFAVAKSLMQKGHGNENFSFEPDGYFTGAIPPLRKDHKSETVSYRADESFAREKIPLQKEYEKGKFSYGADKSFAGAKPSMRKDYKSETVSYRAGESSDREKPPIRKEYENEIFSYGVDESFTGAKSPIRKGHESENVSYEADEHFAGAMPSLRKEFESGTVLYRADESFHREESPIRKEHKNDNFSYGADESFAGAKPSIRKEFERVPYRVDESFDSKNSPLRKEHVDGKISFLEEDNGFTRINSPQRKFPYSVVESLVRTKSPPRGHHGNKAVSYQAHESFVTVSVKQQEDEQIGQSIQFDNLSDLRKFMNTKIFNVEESHMLLLANSFDPVLSEDVNTDELLSVLKKYSTEVKITLSHFIPAKKPINKTTSYDILQNFNVPPELKSFTSKTKNASYVKGECEFIPLLRKSFYQINFPSNQQSNNSPLHDPVQLKPLNLKSFSREYFDGIEGKFVSHILKNPCNETKPSVSPVQNGTLRNETAVINMKSSMKSLKELNMTTSSQSATVQYRKADVKQLFTEMGNQQQSVGVEYWIPQEVFLTKSSELFVDTKMPQDIHRIFRAETTTSSIQMPNHLVVNSSPTLEQKYGSENNYSHISDDLNFRLLFEKKRKEGALNNAETPNRNEADSDYESGEDFKLYRSKLKTSNTDEPPDDDSFIESPKDIIKPEGLKKPISKERDSVIDDSRFDAFSPYRHADHAIPENEYQPAMYESLENNITKKEKFRRLFKLKPNLKTSNPKELLNDDAFIESPEDINEQILQSKQESSLRNNASQSREKDFFHGAYKLKTKNNEMPYTGKQNKLFLGNNSFSDSLTRMNKQFTDLQNYKPLKDSAENKSLHSLFRLGQERTNEEYPTNSEIISKNNAFNEPSVKMEEPAADLRKHEPLKYSDESDKFHGQLKLKQKETNEEYSLNDKLSFDKNAFRRSRKRREKSVTDVLNYKELKDNRERECFTGEFKFGQEGTGNEYTPNPELMSSNSAFYESTIRMKKPVADLRKYKLLKESDESENVHVQYRLKQNGINEKPSSNPEMIFSNNAFHQTDRPIQDEEQQKFFKDSDEINFQGIFRFIEKVSDKEISPDTRIIDLQNDDYHLNKEELYELEQTCQSLSSLSEDKLYDLFGSKFESDDVKPDRTPGKPTSAQEYGSESMGNFHGAFKIKKKQKILETDEVRNTATAGNDSVLQKVGENSFTNIFQGIFRFKQRTKEADTSGKFFKFKTLTDWCENYIERKDPIWFS